MHAHIKDSVHTSVIRAGDVEFMQRCKILPGGGAVLQFLP